MNPSTKGSIAEAVIAAEAVKAGVQVLRPLIEGARYDLVFDVGGRFVRVQCKSVARRGDVLVIPIRTSRHTPQGYVRTRYTADEVDAIAAYYPATDRCYLIPMQDVRDRWEIRLRLARARNNQEFAITYAEDYEFYGAIAQLGERVAGSHEVGGSSPPGSTSRKAA
jgi:hypothetical protein